MITENQKQAIKYCESAGFPSLAVSQLEPLEYLTIYLPKAERRKLEQSQASVQRQIPKPTQKQQRIITYCEQNNQPTFEGTNLTPYNYIATYWEAAKKVHQNMKTIDWWPNLKHRRLSNDKRRPIDDSFYYEDDYTRGIDYGDLC